MIVRRVSKSMVILAFAGMGLASSVGANVFNYSHQYSGAPLGGGSSLSSATSWITASFVDLAAQTVQLTVSAPGLAAGQYVQSLYLNVKTVAAPSLTFSWVSGPTAAIGLGGNNFAAGGGGFYDTKMSFSPNAFTSAQQSIYTITGPAGLSSASFNAISAPTNSQGKGSAPNGTFISAGHILGGGVGGQGAWVSPTAPVPEPETYAMMLVGLALVGFVVRGRKKLQDNAA